MIPELKIMSPDEISVIFERILKLLGEKGVRIRHPGVLASLNDAGAWVDFENEMVRFPRNLVEDLLSKAPHECLLAAPSEQHDLPCPSQPKRFHMCANTGARWIIDPETGMIRDVKVADIAKWGQLLALLDEVDATGFGTPCDVPPETVDIHALKTLLQNTSKHVWVQPHTEGSIKYLIELAIAMAEGKEGLKRRPIISFISDSQSPLEFKSMDLEVVVQASRHGIPVHASSLPIAGATSPVTMAGSVIMAGVETLVQVILAQLIKPGTPVIGLSALLTMDMRTGKALKGSVDAIRGNVAIVQLMKQAYRIPTHCAGLTTDSPALDGQSMLERGLRGLMIAQSGADILGRAGELDAAKIMSPLQLVIDNEITGMLRHLVRGIEFSEEAMAWEDLLAVPPGGNFLMQPHTLSHCRDPFRSRLLDQLSGQDWKDLAFRAQDFYRQLSLKQPGSALSDHVHSEMDLIVREADEALGRRGKK